MRIQILDPEMKFTCGSCTKCCDQPWGTLIEVEKAEALTRHDFSKYPQVAAAKAFFHESRSAPPGYRVLAKGEGTKCLFLDHDGLCIIHKELGAEAKPYPCLKFPYMVARTPNEERISCDFGCPAVQSAKGPELAAQLPDIQRVLPAGKSEPTTGPANVRLDAVRVISQPLADALIDRLHGLFAEDTDADIWSCFSQALATVHAVQQRVPMPTPAGTQPTAPPPAFDEAELIAQLRDAAPLPDAPTPPEIVAYDRPGEAPTPSRLLFAATLFRDTCPPDATLNMSFWRRLTLLPKLMSLAKLNGVYPSRLLGRNVNVREVMENPIEESMPEAGQQLLKRYCRARLWQRLLVGTRLSIVAGLHQHIHDLNAIIFFARAEAIPCQQPGLTDALVRFGLNRVEFHLANQARLFDQANMIGYFQTQLESTSVALASLRLMALRRPQPAATS
jgi:Fe-S-cluster containining protein